MKMPAMLMTVLLFVCLVAMPALADQPQDAHEAAGLAHPPADQGAAALQAEPAHAQQPAHDTHAAPAHDAHGEAAHGEAAHGEAHVEHHEATFKAKEFIAALINFALFLYIIIRFGGKGVKSYFANRASEQMAAVKEAEALLAEVRQMHDKVKARRDNLEAEGQELIENAKRRAQKQADEILATARQQSEKVVADARRTIEGEISQATKKLRMQLVNQALEVAESGISQGLDASAQKNLIEQFMSKMEDPQ